MNHPYDHECCCVECCYTRNEAIKLPQDLKDDMDSVPLVTAEQAKQLADHVRALDMEHAAKKRWIAHQHCITDETESLHNTLFTHP